MSDDRPMRRFDEFRDLLARRASILLVAALVFADLGAALRAPPWPFYFLAVFVVVVALLVGSRRALPRLMWTTEQLGFSRNRDWLHYTIELKGMPRGYLPLAFMWFLAVVLTGLRSPYFTVTLACMLLLAAWASDRRKYPVDLPTK